MPLSAILQVDSVMDKNEVTKNSAADLIMGGLLIVSGILIIIAALNMKVYKSFLDAPGFFPLLLGIIFNVLGIMMISSAVKRKGHEQIALVFTKESLKRFFTHEQFIRVMILIVMMVVYIFGLIGRMHFAAATAIYLFFTLLYLKSASIIKIILISIITGVLISLVFARFFDIPLP